MQSLLLNWSRSKDENLPLTRPAFADFVLFKLNRGSNPDRSSASHAQRQAVANHRPTHSPSRHSTTFSSEDVGYRPSSMFLRPRVKDLNFPSPKCLVRHHKWMTAEAIIQSVCKDRPMLSFVAYLLTTYLGPLLIYRPPDLSTATTKYNAGKMSNDWHNPGYRRRQEVLATFPSIRQPIGMAHMHTHTCKSQNRNQLPRDGCVEDTTHNPASWTMRDSPVTD